MAPVQSLSNYPFGAADDINVGLGRFDGKIVVHCIIADHKEWSKVKAEADRKQERDPCGEPSQAHRGKGQRIERWRP